MKKDLLQETNRTEAVRLNKYMSDAGFCSRREADRLIEEGKVFVDGEKAVTGMRVMPGQVITACGQTISPEEDLVLIAVNKPRGIVCTTDRKREKQNIVDFVGYPSRIYPVGRLDKDSEGLILMTNDGSLVNHILKARTFHEKEYIVKVNRPVTEAFLAGMSAGVPVPEGVTRPCRVRKIDEHTFDIILTQGLNRQIRHMCEYFDYRVTQLKRIRIMNIRLGELKTGKWRHVTPEEIRELKNMIAKEHYGR